MGKYFNQRGYALLIVLLTIIIFLSLSAVFISGFLNHVTQEKTVDMNNQAVVAAEMGVKYINTDIQNKINKEKVSINNEILKLNNKYKNCIGVSTATPKCPDSDLVNKEYKNLNNKEIKEFNLFIKNIHDNLNDDYSFEKLNNSIEKDNGFELSSKLSSYKEDSKYVFNLTIIGYHLESEFSLNSILEFEEIENIYTDNSVLEYNVGVTESISNKNVFGQKPEDKCTDITEKYITENSPPFNCIISIGNDIKEVKNKLTKLNNIKNFNLFFDNEVINFCSGICQETDLENMNLFVYNGDFITGDLKKLKGANIFINGALDTGKLNQLNKSNDNTTTILARSFESAQVNGGGLFNTNLIILGYDSKADILKYRNTFTLNSSSRICINLENASNDSINQIKGIKGKDSFIYYYYPTDLDISSKKNDPTIIYKDTLAAMLEECEIKNYNKADGFILPNINEDLINPVITNVKY